MDGSLVFKRIAWLSEQSAVLPNNHPFRNDNRNGVLQKPIVIRDDKNEEEMIEDDDERIRIMLSSC